MYSRVTMNFVGARKRYEKLDGKDRLVVPMVMLDEGVYEGSQGPYLYERGEMQKEEGTFNHRPLVIDHPTLEGDGVSACDPKIIENQGVGEVYKGIYQDKWKAEAWIDEDKLRKKAPEVLEAINNGRMVEVSTGLFHDGDTTAGVWKNGKEYKGVVRNIRGDHVAILPKTQGAFSIADGGGLLRNSLKGDDGKDLSYNDIREQINCLIREREKGEGGSDYLGCCYISDIYAKYAVYEDGRESYKVGYKVKEGKVSLVGEPEKVHKVTSYITANGQVMVRNEDMQGPMKFPGATTSPIMKHQQMQGELSKHYAGVQQEGAWAGWVTDISDSEVTYFHDGKHLRLPYTYANDKVSFTGTPEQVEVRYTKPPKDGSISPVSNSEQTMPQQKPPVLQTNVIHKGAHELLHDGEGGETPHKPAGTGDGQVRSTAGGARGQETDKMLAHTGGGEEDRKFFDGLPDDQFAKVSKYVLQGAKQEIVPYTYAGIGDRSNAHAHNQAAQQQQQKGPMSTQEWLNSADVPSDVRRVVTNALNNEAREKAHLVKVILSNRGNHFTPEWLMLQEPDMLRGMAALTGPNQQQEVVHNRGSFAQEAVPMFQMNRAGQEITDNQIALPIPTLYAPEELKRAAN